ncbi:Phospholipid hydroperoxide glutathione, partial [Globisporangium polare]
MQENSRYAPAMRNLEGNSKPADTPSAAQGQSGIPSGTQGRNGVPSAAQGHTASTGTPFDAQRESTSTGSSSAMPGQSRASDSTSAMPGYSDTAGTSSAMPGLSNSTGSSSAMPGQSRASDSTSAMPGYSDTAGTSSAMPGLSNSTGSSSAMPGQSRASDSTSAMPGYSGTPSTTQGQSTAAGVPSAAHGHANATTAGSTANTPSVLVGHVFARKHLFLTLPPTLQEDTMMFRTYVEMDKRWLFQNNRHALIKTVYSVKGSELIDAIIHWLQTRDLPPSASPTTQGSTTHHAPGQHTLGGHYHSEGHHVPGQHHTPGDTPGHHDTARNVSGQEATTTLPFATGDAGQTMGGGGVANRGVTDQLPSHSPATTRGQSQQAEGQAPTLSNAHDPAVSKEARVTGAGAGAGAATHHAPHVPTKSHEVTKKQLKKAKKIAEALVLSGFITPYKDDESHLSFIAPNHYVHDNELLVPMAPSVTDLKTTSVWSVVDGAVYARPLKRTKTGLMGKLSDGKDVYVVFNDKTKKLYVFATDLSHEPITEFSGQNMNVAFDNTTCEFGVRVEHKSALEKEKPELFNAESESVQAEVVKACMNIGAGYDEHNVKKLLEAEKIGLVAGDGVSKAHSKRLGLTTEPHEVAMAGVAAAAISGRNSDNNNTRSAMTTGQQNVGASAGTAGVGPTSTTEHGHGHHHTGPHLTSSEHESRPASEFLTPSSERQNQPIGGANPTATSTGAHHNQSTGARLTPGHHQHNLETAAAASVVEQVGEHVGERMASKEHHKYHANSAEYDQLTGVYPASTSTSEHQHQQQNRPRVGEEVSAAMHGDRRNDGSYPATSSTAERHGHHSPSTEYPNQQGGSYPTAAERQNRTVGE